MEYDDQFEVHFPTTVQQRQYTGAESLNEDLVKLILALENKYGTSPDNAATTDEVSTQGGYQTSSRMNLFTVDNAAIDRFKRELLMPAVTAYLDHVFGDEAKQLNPWPHGWAVTLREGDWQGPHWHPTAKNMVSGVYYVKMPGKKEWPQGCIDFINPIPQSVDHGFQPLRRLEPAAGKMILFPPYYIHYVHPFRGEGERMIIAFDVLAQKPGLDFVF